LPFRAETDVGILPEPEQHGNDQTAEEGNHQQDPLDIPGS